jgi:hypothetical protein
MTRQQLGGPRLFVGGPIDGQRRCVDPRQNGVEMVAEVPRAVVTPATPRQAFAAMVDTKYHRYRSVYLQGEAGPVEVYVHDSVQPAQVLEMLVANYREAKA